MTRWARAGNSQKGKIMPKDATSWEELSKGIKSSAKWKKEQINLKVDKSLEDVRTDKNYFNDNKTFSKEKVLNKSFHKNQKIKEDASGFNRCKEVKNAEGKEGVKAISKRQCDEENGDCNETLKIETIEPISTDALPEKQKSSKSEEINLNSHQETYDISSNKNKFKKKELFMKKVQERRAQNRIPLLPPATENRLYKIKKRLCEKGYSPEMIKDIIRKERRKAELEFRKTSFQKTCFNCGQPGHFRADCHLSPNKTSQETLTGFKRGSEELDSSECTEKDYGHTFLKCFVCKGQGHIGRDCPDKKRSAVKEEEPLFALHTIKEGESIDDEVFFFKKASAKPKFKKPKVVVFK